MANTEYAKVGAAWIDGDTGRISLKLGNGMYITLFPNDMKKSEKEPDYRASMKAADAAQIGVEEPAYSKDGGNAGNGNSSAPAKRGGAF